MKKVLGAYIDEKIKEKFEKFCDDHLLNKAKVVEDLIRDYLFKNAQEKK